MKLFALLPFLLVSTVQAATLTATWSDNATNEDEQILQALDGLDVWQDVVSVAPDIEAVDFEYDAATMFKLRVAAVNAYGDAYSNVLLSQPPKRPGVFKVLRKVPKLISRMFRGKRKSPA